MDFNIVVDSILTITDLKQLLLHIDDNKVTAKDLSDGIITYERQKEYSAILFY